MRSRPAAILVVLLACGALAAPSRGATTSACLRGVGARIARTLGVRPAAVTARLGEGGNGMPQCRFRVRRARAGGPRDAVAVTVNVDSAPQAGWRLMRTVVEAQQLWGGVTPAGKKQPIGISGLGPYASWFPELDALMANNRDRRELLTATVVWRHARQAEMIRVARAAIMPYRRVR